MKSASKPRQIVRRIQGHIRQGLLFSLTVIIIATGIYFVPQTIAYWKIRRVLLRPSGAPPRGWSSTPKPLTDTAVSPDKGTVISYYGYSFEVPWTGRERYRDRGEWVEIGFKDGPTIKFVNPAIFQQNPVRDTPALMDHSYFTEGSGGHVPRSKYESLGEILATAPSQLSPFLSHREYRRIRTMLEIKGLMFEHNRYIPDIFSFQTKDYRGFEFSGLSRGWQEVNLSIFDKTDRWFRIGIYGSAGSEAKLTQADANRVIYSFGPKAIGR